MNKPNIGWIGVGNLGTPICRHLMQNGYSLTVCDIDPAKVDGLTRDGAEAADNPAALCDGCEIVFSTLMTEQALLDVVAGDNGLATALTPDHTYIDVSTVSPGVSAEVADYLQPTGTAYLRAPVSGSTANAAQGALTMYVSGPKEAFEACQDVIATIAAKNTHVGEAEEARVLKLLINMIVITTPALLGEALNFGKKSGLAWDAMIDAVLDSVGASPVMQYKAEAMKKHDWTPAATIDLTEKDLALALKWAKEIGAPASYTQFTYDVTKKFQADGEGDRDFFYTLTWPEKETEK